MKKTVKVELEFEVEIPDEKVEEILPDYRTSIKSNANEEDLFKQVAFGAGVNKMRFVEGIGDIRENDITCSEQYSNYECID